MPTLESDWQTENRSPIARKATSLAYDIGFGAVLGGTAGMAAFVETWLGFLQFEIGSKVAFAIIVVAGGFTYTVALDLRRSIRVCTVGYLVGVVMIVLGFVLPGYLVSHLQQAKAVVVPNLMGDSFSVVFYIFSPIYVGSYLFTLSSFSMLE